MVDPLTNEQMSPDASPGTLSRRSGVRRVNNLPMYLIGGVMTVFLAIMVLVAADRAAQQNKPNAGPKEKGGNTRLFASEIAGDHRRMESFHRRPRSRCKFPNSLRPRPPTAPC
jgi:hypothetical protein